VCFEKYVFTFGMFLNDKMPLILCFYVFVSCIRIFILLWIIHFTIHDTVQFLNQKITHEWLAINALLILKQDYLIAMKHEYS